MLSKLAVITLFLTGAYAIVPPKGYVQSPSLAPIISLPTVSPTPTFSLIDQCVDLKSAGYSISCATGTEAVPTDYPPLPTGVRTPPINPHYSARKRRAYRVVDDTAAPSSTGHRAVCYMVNPGHFETRSGLPVAPTYVLRLHVLLLNLTIVLEIFRVGLLTSPCFRRLGHCRVIGLLLLFRPPCMATR